MATTKVPWLKAWRGFLAGSALAFLIGSQIVPVAHAAPADLQPMTINVAVSCPAGVAIEGVYLDYTYGGGGFMTWASTGGDGSDATATYTLMVDPGNLGLISVHTGCGGSTTTWAVDADTPLEYIQVYTSEQTFEVNCQPSMPSTSGPTVTEQSACTWGPTSAELSAVAQAQAVATNDPSAYNDECLAYVFHAYLDGAVSTNLWPMVYPEPGYNTYPQDLVQNNGTGITQGIIIPAADPAPYGAIPIFTAGDRTYSHAEIVIDDYGDTLSTSDVVASGIHQESQGQHDASGAYSHLAFYWLPA